MSLIVDNYLILVFEYRLVKLFLVVGYKLIKIYVMVKVKW